MNIFLIRHGQTQFNKEKIFRGRLDIPLNKIGKEQARAVAQRLDSCNIKGIYSSPLKRALETAEIIGRQLNLQPVIEQGFIDFNFGRWQGLTCKEVQKQFPQQYHQWLKEPHLTKIPKAENLEEVKKRLLQTLNKIIEKKQSNIAVVSHRVAIKVFICAVLSLHNSYFWQIQQDLGAISIIEYKKRKFILKSLNDTCHLYYIKENKQIEDF